MTTKVAIAGCPNGGKTTLFNRLAGSKQTVGNWPGQTVERHEGRFEIDGSTFRAVDLPGTYGLVAVSAEEAIAARYLMEERPQVVVTVVDATNLGPGLHLLAQIAETGLRQVVALNMWDVASRRGLRIDLEVLESMVGVPVVPTVARQGEGIDRLETVIASVAAGGSIASHPSIEQAPLVEEAVAALGVAVAKVSGLEGLGPARWVALQVLAGDEHVTSAIGATTAAREIGALAGHHAARIAEETGFGPEVLLAERRFRWVTEVIGAVASDAGVSETWGDRADRFLTHRWFGLPVFLVVMWVVLRFITDVTTPYVDWIDATIAGPLSRWAHVGLESISLDGGWVESLVVDGVFAGVGGVLAFVPVLFGLYFMLAVLEDSGYMARAAAVMERAMRAVGIPGKAFLPMMVGFGCTVPAIYATRTLESRRDRLLTGLLTPFMSCGARLPVYVLLAGVFFTGSSGTVVFGMYLLGIVVAVLIGWALSRTMLPQHEASSFVMVMPDFRLPNAGTVWALVRGRTWDFVKGAGTLIFAASIGVWLLMSIPIAASGSFADVAPEDSVFGGVSRGVAPIYAPAGFGEWEQSGALITGFVAKEVVVSTMAQLYVDEEPTPDAASATVLGDVEQIGTTFVQATGDTLRAVPGVLGLDYFDLTDEASGHLRGAIAASFDRSSGGHGQAAGLAFMVFVLLYTPCMAAVAAFRQEFGTRWMWVSVFGQFVIAWLGAVGAYQLGRLVL